MTHTEFLIAGWCVRILGLSLLVLITVAALGVAIDRAVKRAHVIRVLFSFWLARSEEKERARKQAAQWDRDNEAWERDKAAREAREAGSANEQEEGDDD